MARLVIDQMTYRADGIEKTSQSMSKLEQMVISENGY